ncbi:MAG TPA: NAD(P)H-dependent oxidoreductase [Gemmatimonadaceae bacterium]|nr:NAD(P)H-dependent oxidoreductase [Gemmatimonadaceae bacterium]
MPKVLVLFHSRTGHTARIADAVADGARAVQFTEVDVRRIDDLTPSPDANAGTHADLARRYRTLESVERLVDYDAIVLGSPARYGVMAAEVQQLLARAGRLLDRGALADRVGAAFSSAELPHGGWETTTWSMLTALSHFRMLLVGPEYAGGTGEGNTPSDPPELANARALGRRVAEVAGWVVHVKHHHHH